MDLNKMLIELDKRLTEKYLILELKCVGGYVLQLYGLKTTSDIDAFYESTKEIENIIKNIGEEFGVNNENQVWLNNDVSNFINNSGRRDYKLSFKGESLTVYVSDLYPILIDKVIAGRIKDVEDIKNILILLNFTDFNKVIEEMEESGELYDPRVFMEAYGMAFGREKLKEELDKSKFDILNFYK